jgi:hypothetical protein
MLQKIGFPQPANDVFIAYCGPKDFDKAVKEEILLAHGYKEGDNF